MSINVEVKSFVEITGASQQRAVAFLQKYKNNLDYALRQWFEQDQENKVDEPEIKTQQVQEESYASKSKLLNDSENIIIQPVKQNVEVGEPTAISDSIDLSAPVVQDDSQFTYLFVLLPEDIRYVWTV